VLGARPEPSAADITSSCTLGSGDVMSAFFRPSARAPGFFEAADIRDRRMHGRIISYRLIASN
jgi:hypothetical protein